MSPDDNYIVNISCYGEWVGGVSRNDLMIVERKILAIVGENAAPIAVPLTC